jgi:Zn-finger nucleic acid-binding protein
MGLVNFKTFTIDRCVNCKGLWFDRREMEQLQGIRGSEVIDSSRTKTGKSFDTLKDISCPRCIIPMDKIQDTGKAQFTYENCSQCHGVFLDAGEFKELKDEHSILAFLKKLL